MRPQGHSLAWSSPERKRGGEPSQWQEHSPPFVLGSPDYAAAGLSFGEESFGAEELEDSLDDLLSFVSLVADFVSSDLLSPDDPLEPFLP